MFLGGQKLLGAAMLLAFLAAPAAAQCQRGEDGRFWNPPDALSPEQRVQAEHILKEARPRLRELTKKIHDKMLQLKSFVYDKDTDPEVLPRLGRELQTLRNELRQALHALDQRLEREAGVLPPRRRGRGCAALHRTF